MRANILNNFTNPCETKIPAPYICFFLNSERQFLVCTMADWMMKSYQLVIISTDE